MEPVTPTETSMSGPSAGSTFSVSITIERDSKIWKPKINVQALWQNRGDDSDDIETDYMVALGSVENDGSPGNAVPVSVALSYLLSTGNRTADAAILIGQSLEATRDPRLARLLEIVGSAKSPDDLRKELEDLLSLAADIAISTGSEVVDQA